MLKIQFKDRRREPVWAVEKAFTIGSAPDNSLVINDDSVDGYHARLLGDNGQFVLQDTGSTNGTFVNGQRINKRHVGCPDTIRLGEVELEIVDPLQDHAADDLPYWALVADGNWMSGQEFPLRPQAPDQEGGAEPASLLIGRGRHCDIVFPGTHLSKEHARVVVERDSISLTDLATPTGTYVNDERITGTAKVRAGDRIRLDIYSFTLLGPGIQVPQSTSHPLPESPHKARADEAPSAPKHWKTRPTSPGNREEPTYSQSNSSLLWLSVLLVLTLIVAAAYLLLH